MLYMFVMTVDQRKSTQSGQDLIPQLEKLVASLDDVETLRPFQRTAGDEAQAVFEEAEGVLAVAKVLVRQGNWHVGIGAGAVDLPLPQETRAGNGRAYINARYAVERAKKSPGHIAFEGNSPFSSLIEATLQLVMKLEVDRKKDWQEVGELYEQGLTQKDIAAKMGTHQPAVSRVLSQGYWKESRRVLRELVDILEEEKRWLNQR